MPISPQEISNREFFPAKDGYDKEEVRAFLGVVGRDQQALMDRIQSLENADDELVGIGSQIASVLQNANQAAENVTEQADARAAEVRRRAEDEAALLRQATADSTDRLKEEAEQYAFDVRTAAERAARGQQVQTADRVGRLLAGESTVRERLYSLEITLQGMRGELKGAAESVYPELANASPPPPLPQQPRKSLESEGSNGISVIDLREGRVTANGSDRP